MKVLIAMLWLLGYLHGIVLGQNAHGYIVGLENRNMITVPADGLEVGDIVIVSFEEDSVTVYKGLTYDWDQVHGRKPMWRECVELPDAAVSRIK